jgi:hypothetical protein
MNWESAINAVRPHLVKIETPSGYGAGLLVLYNHDKTWCGIATAAHVVSYADENKQPIRIGNEATVTPKLLLDYQRTIFLDQQNNAAIIFFQKGNLRLPESPITHSQWALIQSACASPMARWHFLTAKIFAVQSRIRGILNRGTKRTATMETLKEPLNSLSKEIQCTEIDRGEQKVFEEFIMPNFPMYSHSEDSWFEWRAFWVSTLYGSGCPMLAVGFWKAVVIWFMTYILQLLPLGRRHVERIGFLFIGASIIMWTSIAYICGPSPQSG